MELGARPKTKYAVKSNDSNTEDDNEEEGSIENLPDEILEYIFSLISPYSDLDSCSQVCSRWLHCCRRVVALRQQHFHCQTAAGQLLWSHQPVETDNVSSISKRYSHCAVYYPDKSVLYVFGGCTSTSSTFNDLWELNLSTRSWRRPVSMGAYPSPKACASMVRHGDMLVLFGGWTHPSLYPLHQSWKLFSELHIYYINENVWSLLTTDAEVRPPAMAGHSATVHRGRMVVFGGLHKQRSVGHYTSSNDIWVYNLETNVWERQLTGGSVTPLPRYGQSQIFLDDDHLLILGGCGGPNNEYTDIWLLDMSVSPWTWIQMEVRGNDNRARDIWCHPAVRVDTRVVVLGKCRNIVAKAPSASSASTNSSQSTQAWNVIPQLRRGLNRGQASIRRVSAPAPHHVSRDQVSSSDSDMELAVEPVSSRQSLRSLDDGDQDMSPSVSLHVNNLGRPGPSQPSQARQQTFRSSVSLNITGPSAAQAAPATVRSSLPPSNPVNAPNALIPVKVTPAHNKVLGPAANTGNQDPSVAGPRAREVVAGAGQAGGQSDGARAAVGLPQKNRQKMLENRQRQLASLQRMEEKIRNSGKSQSSSSQSKQNQQHGGNKSNVCPHHRMTTHILDISNCLTEHYVTWQPISPILSPEAPQESILYSLVLGRTELIMFGGLQKDVSLSTGRTNQQNNSETVSNCLYYLNPPQITI